jgi:hypothetical protein
VRNLTQSSKFAAPQLVHDLPGLFFTRQVRRRPLMSRKKA